MSGDLNPESSLAKPNYRQQKKQRELAKKKKKTEKLQRTAERKGEEAPLKHEEPMI